MITSPSGPWYGVWHVTDEEFILLELGDRDMCQQLIQEMSYPDHLEVRRLACAGWVLLDE